MNKTDLLQEKITLWTSVFGDTREFAEMLFSLSDVPTVTVGSDTEIFALAGLVPVQIEDTRGFYVYGVCVTAEHRGEGLFSEIMRLCETEAKARGGKFLCLIPADSGLDGKYDEFGYKTKIALKGEETEPARTVLLLSSDFGALVKPADGALPIYTHGRLKPLADGVPRENLVFSDYMGER